MDIILHNFITDMPSSDFLGFYALVIVAILILCWILKHVADSSRFLPRPFVPEQPDPYEIAYLRNGEKEVALILLPLTSFNCCLGCITLQCPLIIFLILIPFVLLIWPGLAPFGLFQFWGWWGSLLDIAMLFWPMLAVGLLLTLLNTARIRDQADVVLVNTRYFFFTYLRAGPLEELVYRWLFFYGALIYLPLVNFISFGLLQWSYSTLGSIADFFTFHQLHAYLFNSQYSWIVGQAILLVNGNFRDGHSYQGILGWIWSWFIGMFFFLIMFRHGLFAAIFVHSFYNLCVTTLAWLIARLHMTPEEAQALVAKKLEMQ